MKCGNCGSDLPEDSIYCLVCGRKAGDEQSNVVSYADLPFGTVIKCPKCGATNSRTDRWCGSCDAELETAKKVQAVPALSGPECPSCGVRGIAGSSYCRRCGASFSPVPKDQSTVLSVVFGDSEPGLALGGVWPTHQREIIRERQVIMIRCKYCGTLNGPDAVKCSSCGAQM